MNTAFDNLHGNDKLKERLSKAFAAKTLAHAYILEGKNGSGKHTMADIIAAGIGCNSSNAPCGVCESCRKIFSHIESDISYIELTDDKKSISVETIRNLHMTAYIKPTELDYKFFIIGSAEQMTPAAQNALLLLLEEPPANVYFLLLAESASGLLPTIRSRAPILRMQLFSDREISEYLKNNSAEAAELLHSDSSAFNFAVKSSCGSLGAALNAANAICKAEKNNALSVYSAVKSFFELICNAKSHELPIFFSKQSLTRDEAVFLLTGIENALRDITALKYCSSPELIFFENENEASAFADRLTRECVLGIYEAVRKTRENISQNTNVNTSLALLSINIRQKLKS